MSYKRAGMTFLSPSLIAGELSLFTPHVPSHPVCLLVVNDLDVFDGANATEELVDEVFGRHGR